MSGSLRTVAQCFEPSAAREDGWPSSTPTVFGHRSLEGFWT